MVMTYTAQTNDKETRALPVSAQQQQPKLPLAQTELTCAKDVTFHSSLEES